MDACDVFVMCSYFETCALVLAEAMSLAKPVIGTKSGGNFEIIKDFLPSPAQLAKMESNVKVTINLRKSSVDFFKDVAKKNNVQYQRVIRSLLDTYANSCLGSR